MPTQLGSAQERYSKGEKFQASQRRYLKSIQGRATRSRMAREKYRHRRLVLDQIKLVSGCVDCGFKGHAAALQFDHVRGTKVRDVSQMMGHSLEAQLAEIAKCDVRCANCHAIRTHPVLV